MAGEASLTTFQFERLDVYHACVEFYDIARAIVRDLPRGYGEEKDQLTRAALSCLLNTCEGAGEFSRAEKARFYRMALRSATESAALIRLFERDLSVTEMTTQAVELLLKIVAMLTSLAKRFQEQT